MGNTRMLPLVFWQVLEDRADGLPVAQYIDAPAHIGRRQATALIPEHDGGMAAIRILMQKIDRPDRSVVPAVIGFGFEPGETCAPPRT